MTLEFLETCTILRISKCMLTSSSFHDMKHRRDLRNK